MFGVDSPFGCRLSIFLYSRLPYWCTSSYIVDIQNILYLSLNVDIVSKSQADGVLLEILDYINSVYKSTKHFGLRFACNAPKIWNDLPDDVHSAPSLHSFRKGNLKPISL